MKFNIPQLFTQIIFNNFRRAIYCTDRIMRADQHEDSLSILRAFKSHVTMLGPIISRTEIVPGRAHVARGSITIVAALSREKMQNCRREHSRGCIKSGVVIYRNSCGHSRTAQHQRLLVTFAENFPLVISCANKRLARVRQSRLRVPNVF